MATAQSPLLTILLVEDNEDDVALMRRALAKAQIANPFVHVDDGVRALDYLVERAGYLGFASYALPVLVLLDVNLPRLDGFGLLKSIRAHDELRSLPVAMLISSDQDRIRFTQLHPVACSYLMKPLDFDQLARVAGELGLGWTAFEPPLARGSDASIPLARPVPLALCPRR